ncbi:MAG: FAD-dependent oxidoreductase [Burkholderiales bacterium]
MPNLLRNKYSAAARAKRIRNISASPRQVLLLGGGHAHVEVLRRFRMAPVRGAGITLISPHQHATYSGMLPGWVAGHYKRAECCIDLAALCGPGIRLHGSAARHIDAARKRVLCEDGSEHSYDLLSVDVGSVSALDGIVGAGEAGVRVKPMEFGHVEDLAGRMARGEARRIVIVGGGAAGVELCLALRHRTGRGKVHPEFHLVIASNTMLEGHNLIARMLVRRSLAQVRVHLGKQVVRATERSLHFLGGGTLEFDALIWATGAAAPAWLATSGLMLDARGFILVDEHLQSVSHASVFAAGDVASMRHHTIPKSGVYAVRQGPLLAENLRRALHGQTLQRYTPQARALALISTGPRHAIAAWGPLAWSGAWVWRWKDAIDRRFVERYREPR